MHRRFQEFVISTNSNIIDTSVIINWKATLGKEREWHLGALKGFLLSWHEYGYYGVDKSVVSLLESFTLSGNEKEPKLHSWKIVKFQMVHYYEYLTNMILHQSS